MWSYCINPQLLLLTENGVIELLFFYKQWVIQYLISTVQEQPLWKTVAISFTVTAV